MDRVKKEDLYPFAQWSWAISTVSVPLRMATSFMTRLIKEVPGMRSGESTVGFSGILRRFWRGIKDVSIESRDCQYLRR